MSQRTARWGTNRPPVTPNEPDLRAEFCLRDWRLRARNVHAKERYSSTLWAEIKWDRIKRSGINTNHFGQNEASYEPFKSILTAGSPRFWLIHARFSKNAGGIWKFADSKLNQKQTDGARYAAGPRQMPAIASRKGVRSAR